MFQLVSKRLISGVLLCGLLVFSWQAFGSSETYVGVEPEHRSSDSSSVVDSVQRGPVTAVQVDLNPAEDGERDVAIVWDGVARSGGGFGNV